MKIKPSFIPAYEIYEYRIILQPHEDLCNKINAIKRSFAESYQLPVYRYAKPDITLVRFTQYEMPEERIMLRLQNIATNYASFTIELKDFSSFPTHSIFINVASKTNIVALVKEIKSIQKWMKPDDEHKPHYITEPFITIAAKLLPWQYEKAWVEFSNTNFTAMFMTNEILLLKRKQGETKYKTVKRFQFLNQKTVTAQTSLFI